MVKRRKLPDAIPDISSLFKSLNLEQTVALTSVCVLKELQVCFR